jgi:hypothetical protein
LIIVDSSVWIDYFNGVGSPAASRLDSMLGVELLGIGDLILAEVLQGFRSDAHYRAATELMLSMPVFDMLGKDMALRSAGNYRTLRAKGITVRRTADVIIASYCIKHELPLLFEDKDFLPFVQNLGLRTA